MRKQLTFLISSLNSGGAERVVSTLANRLVDKFNITIILLYKSEPFYDLDDRITIKYCFEKYSGKVKHLKLLNKVYKKTKESRTDVLIGFMTTANIYAVIVSKFLRIPCIISERIHPEFSSISKPWFKIRKIIYPKCNILVVQTNEIKAYFSDFMKDSKIRIMKNPLSKELTESRQLNASKENIILNVGRLDNQKKQDLLIRAFANIGNDKWKVLIIGDGQLRSQYESLITSLKLEGKVELLRSTSDVATYYNKSRIFVFTSIYEGFPNALTEAMYFGLSSVSTDCPSGPAELIKDGENGFLIPINDQEMLETRLSQLMSDNSIRQKFKKNSISTTEKFESDKVVSEWEILITELLK